jgi:hypothetical protein
MTITFNGPDIETTDSGFLVNIEDWSASLARYRGDVCFNNNQSQRNTLLIVKAMIGQCGAAADRKVLCEKVGREDCRLTGEPAQRRLLRNARGSGAPVATSPDAVCGADSVPLRIRRVWLNETSGSV